jgi:hypothetical protein
MEQTIESMIEKLSNTKTVLKELEDNFRQLYLETDIIAFWMGWCFIQMALNDIGGVIWTIKTAQQMLKEKNTTNIT